MKKDNTNDDYKKFAEEARQLLISRGWKVARTAGHIFFDEYYDPLDASNQRVYTWEEALAVATNRAYFDESGTKLARNQDAEHQQRFDSSSVKIIDLQSALHDNPYRAAGFTVENMTAAAAAALAMEEIPPTGRGPRHPAQLVVAPKSPLDMRLMGSNSKVAIVFGGLLYIIKSILANINWNLVKVMGVCLGLFLAGVAALLLFYGVCVLISVLFGVSSGLIGVIGIITIVWGYIIAGALIEKIKEGRTKALKLKK